MEWPSWYTANDNSVPQSAVVLKEAVMDETLERYADEYADCCAVSPYAVFEAGVLRAMGQFSVMDKLAKNLRLDGKDKVVLRRSLPSDRIVGRKGVEVLRLEMENGQPVIVREEWDQFVMEGMR